MPDSVSHSLPRLFLGTDLVRVSRLQKSYDRFGMSFFKKLLTDDELTYCLGGQPENRRLKISVFLKIAARLAVKEATAKALGTGLNGVGWSQGIRWHEVTVQSEPQSPPKLSLSGQAARVAEERGIQDWRLSFSHDGDYALATVVGLGPAN